MENLLFDTVVFEARPLDYLIEMVGSERVLFGTDLPFDMGDDAALRDLGGGARKDLADRVLGGNALEAFGIEFASKGDAERVRS
jgi:aminocarboxymuconate-semialdehyde decarboxylase